MLLCRPGFLHTGLTFSRIYTLSIAVSHLLLMLKLKTAVSHYVPRLKLFSAVSQTELGLKLGATADICLHAWRRKGQILGHSPWPYPKADFGLFGLKMIHE